MEKAQRFCLEPPFIIHWVEYMVREVCLATLYHASLTASASVFLFVDHLSVTAEKLCAKLHLWDNMLRETRVHLCLIHTNLYT